jgi:hypothetical protein
MPHLVLAHDAHPLFPKLDNEIGIGAREVHN